MSKSSSDLSFEATKMVLENKKQAMKFFDIWQEIKANDFFGFGENLGFSGATPEQSFYAASLPKAKSLPKLKITTNLIW